MVRDRASRRVNDQLGRVLIPQPWDLGAYLDALAETRGREFELIPLHPAAPAGLCGLSFPAGHKDVIMHRAVTDPERLALIVCHEVGHLLMHHPTDATADPGELAKALTGVAEDEARGVPERLRMKRLRSQLEKSRSIYDDRAEYEAELFARTIAGTVRRRSGNGGPGSHLGLF